MNKTVITNGVFDVFHVGHFNLLMFCRSLAGPKGRVIVLLDDDSKVRKDKGEERPIFTARERLVALDSLVVDTVPVVDEIHIFYNDEDLNQLIKQHHADILVKGSDWGRKRVIGAEHVKSVVFFDFVDGHSSSTIIDRIKNPPRPWRALSEK